MNSNKPFLSRMTFVQQAITVNVSEGRTLSIVKHEIFVQIIECEKNTIKLMLCIEQQWSPNKKRICVFRKFKELYKVMYSYRFDCHSMK